MALDKLIREDPTFKVHTDQDTGQTIISGMGELHIEILVDRMVREFGVAANVGKPQVAYRETIRQRAEAEGKFIRQTGGRGQYGHVKIVLEPWRAGRGLRVRERDCRGHDSRASTFRRSSRASRRHSRPEFWPAMRWWTSRVTLIDGSYHEVDSSEMAFKIAGSMALKEAAKTRQTGAARTDDGRGSRGAGGVHGRSHRRPALRAAAGWNRPNLA